MSNNQIKCPHCGKDIEVTEVLTHSIREGMRGEMERELTRKEQEYAKKQSALAQKERELQQRQETFEEHVARQVQAERKKIVEQERTKLLAEQREQAKALQEEIDEKDRKIKEFQHNELELRKQQKKLKEDKEAFELEMTRQLDEERQKITDAAKLKATQEQQLKLREKDELIRAMQTQMENLQRRLEQGSQEAQGEAFETILQERLQQLFPHDQFTEVKKGQRGGDIVQIVRNRSGKDCGRILWESKNTKAFSRAWIAKLKADQQEAGAEVAVLVTMALPKEVEKFGVFEDVWLSDFICALGLAAALRETLIQVKRERVVNTAREGLKDIVYSYITGPEFRERIKAILTSYQTMQVDLETEKRAMLKIWKKREMQISLVFEQMAGISGELEGIIGKQALPPMRPLSLEGITEE